MVGTDWERVLRFSATPGKQEPLFLIRLDADLDPDVDIIYIEATEEQYRAWRREQNAHDYLRRYGMSVSVMSMDYPPMDSEVDSLHELVANVEVDVERSVLSNLAHEKLEQVLATLSAEDTKLLVETYLEGKCAAEIARERGVHRSTVARQVSALVERLKKFF